MKAHPVPVFASAPKDPKTVNPQTESKTMQLTSVLEVFKRRWLIISITAAVVTGIVAAATFFTTPQYESHTEVFVSVNSGNDVTSLSQGGDFSTNRVKSYIALVTSRPVLTEVIDELNLNESPEALAERIHAETEPETVLLTVRALDPDPEAAADIANSVTRHFMALVERLERPGGSESPLVALSLVQTASPLDVPVSPDIARNLIFGLIAGLVVGTIAGFVRNSTDTRVRDPQEASRLTGAPLLVRLPEDAKAAANTRAMTSSPTAFAEAVRLLRARLKFADVDDPVTTLVVTAVSSGEGKSSVAIHLASAMTESGLKVLLIDADLRRPVIADKLGLEPIVGLTSVLTHQTTLPEALQRSGPGGYDVLTTGMLPPNPSELLESATMRSFVAEIRKSYDFIIIDSPPAGATADPAILGALTDGFLFVVRADGKTSRDALQRVHNELTGVGMRSLGVVANRCHSEDVDANEYYRHVGLAQS